MSVGSLSIAGGVGCSRFRERYGKVVPTLFREFFASNTTFAQQYRSNQLGVDR